MKKITELISEELKKAFAAAGYDEEYGRVTVSNRPDLAMYQCNGCMSAAKKNKCAPIKVAEAVIENITDKSMFSKIEAVMPGFINIDISDSFLVNCLNNMAADAKLGVEEKQEKIVIDYGGPNVAKPLHVGHLRSAVIGESLKRIFRFRGAEVIGDAHLGDWGLQIGLIIMELKDRKPDLPYYDENYTGEYPSEAPFTMDELQEIYPAANVRAKEDEAFKESARHATFLLQNGHRGYLGLWKHIMEVSVADLKKNYERLNVSFDVWGRESDAQNYIPDMVQGMKDGGFAYISDGALVVDVKEDTDKKEMPPCMILKSDGATLYNTTDLATIVERMGKYNPDRIVYVTDARQSLYFEQIFRCAKKTGLVPQDFTFNHLGFGTVNGEDGKPFKTRDGGVAKLSYLIDSITEEVKKKMADRDMPEDEMNKVAEMVGVAAIKYGDLSNQPGKDYIFSIEKFASFEGNTGPYILYTTVRIKSILQKVSEGDRGGKILDTYEAGEAEKNLRLKLLGFNDTVEHAADELAPNRICLFLFELSNAFNGFYHECHIIAEENEEKRKSWIALLELTKKVLECGADMLGFEAPDRM
ncbi:MAG: arginine--tRNA ligase [Lachnospiraceae bacterium]|nr:arginine--tRNA ligase [Lachnospiraceae bacterium]